MNNHTHYLILHCNTCAFRVAYMVAFGETHWEDLTYLSEKFEDALRLEYECPKCDMMGALGEFLCNGIPARNIN